MFRDADAESSRSSRPAYKKAFGKIRSMENYLALRQRSERDTMGRTYSDEEDDVEAESTELKSSLEAGKKLKTRPKSKSFFSRLRKVNCIEKDKLYSYIIAKKS